MVGQSQVPEVAEDSRVLFHWVTQQLPAMIWSTDCELRIISVSGAVLSALDVSPDGIIGTTLPEFYGTEDPNYPPLQAHLRALQGETVAYEIELVGRTFRCHVGQLRDDGGTILGCAGVAQDVTECKQAEEARRESQRALQIQNGIDEIFLTSPDDQMYGEVLQFVLEAMESQQGVFGYVDEAENLVCPSMTRDIWDQCQIADKDIIFPRAKWGGLWGRCLVERRSLYSNEPGKVPRGHIPIERALATPIVYRGETIGLLNVANKRTDYGEQDVALLERIASGIAPVLQARVQRDRQEVQRRQLAHDLGERVKELNCLYTISRLVEKPGVSLEEIFQGTVEVIPPAWKYPEITSARIVFEDQQFKSAEFRETALRQTAGICVHGERKGAVEVYYLDEKPKSDEGPFLKEERDLINAIAERLGRIVERVRAEEALHKAHHELERRVQERTAELREANEQLRREMEDRRRAEKALAQAKRLASIGTLAGGIAHEINNPLHAISMSSAVALRANQRTDGAQIRDKFLHKIQDEALRCGRIVKSVLQFARQESSEKWPCSLTATIRRAVDLTQKSAAIKAVSVQLERCDRLPEVTMNPTEMEQVFVNLLSNAIQASKPGDCVTVRAETTDEAVRVQVEDRGCGMTKEQADHIFEPFFTTRQQDGGTGLGLSVTHGIIQQHRGTIAVESDPGEGTIFTLVLPPGPPAVRGARDGEGPDR